MLAIERRSGRLVLDDGHCFDPRRRSWIACEPASATEPIAPRDAVAWLQRDSGHPLRVPVGVIGPREARPEQTAAAETLGAGLAVMGLTIVCGGRQGVMEAVCRGATNQGGLTIGLLPETDPAAANPFVSVPLATGIGEARNALIARAAFCLVAVGDSHGTLSEVALGLQFGKAVFGLCGAARIRGVEQLAGPEEALDAVAARVLDLPFDRPPPAAAERES